MGTQAAQPGGGIEAVKSMGRISAASRNFLIAYVLLVGLPLLGLIGVLKAGRRLTAPISVDGTWKLDTTAGYLLSGPCGKPLASLQSSTMTISQSGTSLVLALGEASKALGSGTIDGTALRGTMPLNNEAAARDPSCGTNLVLALAANVDPKTEPRSMTGTIVVSGCSSCATINYRSVREIRSGRRGAH